MPVMVVSYVNMHKRDILLKRHGEKTILRRRAGLTD